MQALRPFNLSSALDDATLKEMRQMELTSGASFISFQVLAIARYAGYPISSPSLSKPHLTRARLAEPRSRLGSLVVIYTHVGEITLDGEAIFFHETLAGAFSRAGFIIDSTGRRLLGVIEVIGMFNFISKAATEALARNPAAAVPATLPSEFAALVVFTEACEDPAGKTTLSCDLGSGERVDWATSDAKLGAVLRTDEVQYSLKLNGQKYARETATSNQWPMQSVTALYNETHKLRFQTYRGVNYHCDLSTESSLRAPPQAGDGTRIDMVGYTELEGIYCRHFRMTIPAGERPEQVVHVYEDYVQRRLRAIRYANIQWLFVNLTTVSSEAENPLSPQELDLDAVLRSCDPPGLVPPARIVRGLLTPRLTADVSWGANATSLEIGPGARDFRKPLEGHSLLRALPDSEDLVGANTSRADGQPGLRAGARSSKSGFFNVNYEEGDLVNTFTLSGAGSGPYDCPEVSGTRPRLRVHAFFKPAFCKSDRRLNRHSREIVAWVVRAMNITPLLPLSVTPPHA
jgi:hypothetical protein